ncbi:sugar ABC transporter permease [Actinomadura vinacea]|uniref:Sugar ABC transporter permease n=1 Tax=Actinomadura vinacea TaxID=115336 RepID=A0ABN3IAQ9_9ACTN
MSRRHPRAAAGFLAPFCLLFLVFFVLPIGYAVYQSLLKVERTGPLGLGEETRTFAGLHNYARAFGEPGFVDSLWRVLVFAAVEVPVMIGLATVLALMLDAASARGVRFFRTAFFLPYGVPGVIASILWGFLYVPGISPILSVLEQVGVRADLLGPDTVLWSIANIVTWEFAGYNMLVVIAQLQAIDRDLYESAGVDGASAWQVVRHIKLPLVRPALVLTTVFTIIGTLQLFAEPLVLQPLARGVSSHYTPNMSAYSEAFANNDYNLAAAEAVLLALIAFVLSFGFLRMTSTRVGR